MHAFRLRDYSYPLGVLKYHRLFKRAPHWSVHKLEAWSRARRTAIAAHAYAHVPYYRRLFDEHAIRPSEVGRAETWERIPLLEKEIIQANTDDFISRTADPKRTMWVTTSGSTGMQLRILLDHNINAAAFALFWRAWGSGGYYHLGQHHAVMKSMFYEAGWRYNRAIRALELSTARVGPENVRLFRDLILKYRPRFMRGYPSAMYLFSRVLREEGLDLHIPMIITGSETLYDFQRLEIENVLGARVYNHYTHWERCASVLECEAGRMHAQLDYGFHEILGEDGLPVPPNVNGVVTVTTMHNLAMPLIRYRTGDIASWSSERCECGQSFPVINRIEGRQTDYLIAAEGTLISGTFAAEALTGLPHLMYYQIVQEELGKIEVRIVKGNGYQPESTHAVLTALQARVGPGIQIGVRFCGLEGLERNPVGKIRQCFNRLTPEDLARVNIPVRWGLHVARTPGGDRN
ncbi:MAG: phenylacetate--CoA ligase family protein [Gammaproteobacteria bacterium]